MSHILTGVGSIVDTILWLPMPCSLLKTAIIVIVYNSFEVRHNFFMLSLPITTSISCNNLGYIGFRMPNEFVLKAVADMQYP